MKDVRNVTVVMRALQDNPMGKPPAQRGSHAMPLGNAVSDDEALDRQENHNCNNQHTLRTTCTAPLPINNGCSKAQVANPSRMGLMPLAGAQAAPNDMGNDA